MGELTPAALALDGHLTTAANPGGPRTVCACGEGFDSNVEFLNHVAERVLLASGVARTNIPPRDDTPGTGEHA